MSCDDSGRCTPHPEATRISTCVHCGKELIEVDGQWFTWDVDFHTLKEPQH